MNWHQDRISSPLLVAIHVAAIQTALCLVAFLVLGAMFGFRREVYQSLVGWIIGLAIFDLLVAPCMNWVFNKITAN